MLTTQRALGFPTDFFPVLFAVPRVVGWLAHWRQLMLSRNVKIWRPRQVYTGEGERAYIGMKEREEKGTEGTKRGGEPTKVRPPCARRGEDDLLPGRRD